MNDMPQFQPQPPMFDDSGAAKAPVKRRRKARAVQPENETERKPRKPRQKPVRLRRDDLKTKRSYNKRGRPPKTKAVVPQRNGKLEVSDIVNATVGLKPDEASALLTLHGQLSQVPKKSRIRILHALGRLHG